MELTNDEKAKVFAMYLGCNVKSNNGSAFVYSPHSCANSGYKLILTPLSKISDEHAIEVANLIVQDKGYAVKLRTPLSMNIYGNYYQVAISFDYFSLSCFYSFYGERKEINLTQIISGYINLIQQGYAIPLFFGLNHWANGKTPFELNLAIEKV